MGSNISSGSGRRYLSISMREFRGLSQLVGRRRGKLYEFTHMPFGLHNAPHTWQKLMDMELA
jgi:hypothetical protein